MTRREFLLCIAPGALAAVVVPRVARAAGEPIPVAAIEPLSRAVGELLEASPYNRLPGTETRIYDAPVFGVSSPRDPLYRKLKEVVGPDHFMPEDFLPGAKTVIAYFLPYSGVVSRANYGPEDSPALWVLAHRRGAAAAELVRRFIAKRLTSLDARVLLPFHDSHYKTGTLVSNWSERHVSFISGLGTFGLHKSIITQKGSSGRLDSVITDREFTPTKRDYEGVYDRCIKCYACVSRCPVGAIRESGKSIPVCARRVLAGKVGPEQAVCGKCLTQVSCENCTPRRRA